MGENTVPKIESQEEKKKPPFWLSVLPFRKPHYPPKPTPEEEREAVEDAKKNFIEPIDEKPQTPLMEGAEEPEIGDVAPVKESVPFEEERRSYDRRKPTKIPWLGEERRKRDRRQEPTFTIAPKTIEEKKETAPFQKHRLFRKFIFLVLLSFCLGAITYWLF